MGVHRKLGVLWVLLALTILLVTGSLGFLMRLGQSGLIGIDPGTFYTILTFHGQANAVIFFLAALMMARALLSAYLELSYRISLLSSTLMLVGVLGVAFSVIVGRLATGWYFLYPIIFYEGSTVYRVLWIISVILVGLGVLLAALDIVRASIKKYGLSASLGWHYISGEEGPDVPPIVLIATASSIATIAAMTSGAVLLTGFLVQSIGVIGGIDPLGAKNLTFMFGHCMVNLAMFYTIASVYETLPRYSGKPWKAGWMVAVAWNIAVIYVLLAMFHHLYMDFVQPLPYQFAGQIFSYIAAIPAIVVTIIGALAQIFYHRAARNTFSMVPAFILAGITAWIIGGAAAVVDATIPANFRFHNTLWVPAHFHTYYAYGVVVMLTAILWSTIESSESTPPRRIWLPILAVITIGWAIHLASFYIGGAVGVPRRYASYQALPDNIAHAGSMLATISAIGIIVFAVGYLVLYYQTLRSAWKKLGVL